MKTLASLLIAIVALALGGCQSMNHANTVTDAMSISAILDKVLLPDFNGPLHISHKNPYFDFTIDAGGLHRTDKGWTCIWLRYHRSDRATSGDIVLGIPPS